MRLRAIAAILAMMQIGISGGLTEEANGRMKRGKGLSADWF